MIPTMLLLITCYLASRVQGEAGGVLAFAMAGLACSAFLPLSISFGDTVPQLVECDQLARHYSGQLWELIAAAFGTGPLRDLIGLPFSTIFATGSVVALLLAIIAGLIIRGLLEARRHPIIKA